MIRRLEVGHFEFDELSAVVPPRAEGDWENYRTKCMRRVTWDDAVERGFAQNQHVLEVQAHLPQSAGEDEVEVAPTIDEDLSEPDLCHNKILNQGELAGLREAHPLIVTGEQDGDLRPTEWSRHRRLDGHDLPKKKLLVPPGAEIPISPEDDVDDLRSVLELRVAPLVFLVVILGFLVRRLLVLLTTTRVAERPPEVVAVDGRVVGTWMPWALLLQELLELLQHRRLLATRGTIHSRDEIIWLALSGCTRIVPLAFVVAVVIWAPQIAILALREPLPHLLLLFGPIVHHITKARNSLWPVPPKIPVDAWVGDAIVEAVDDVILRDVRDGGADVEEATCAGPQELVTFLFTLSKIVMSTCASDRSLEVVDEDLLESLLGVDGVVAEALQPRKRRRVQSHREVDDLGDVGAPCNLNGRGVPT
jgi:hypothetical protein